METIALTDENTFPDEAVLKSVLGRGYAAYTRLLALYEENGLVHEWRFYRDGKAWLCKVQHKKRTIVWMSAWKGYMKATIYFPVRYLEAILGLSITEESKERVTATKNVGKTRPFTFEIRSTEAIAEFEKVMQFKLHSK